MLSANGLLRSRTARFLLVTGVLVAPFMLAGCSGTSHLPATQSMGPLDEYMSQMRMSEEAVNEAARSEHERAEQLKAMCMSKEGFDYKPLPFTGGPVTGGLTGNGLPSETDTQAEQFAATYGYGIVEDPNLDAATQVADEQVQGFVDVNSDYVNSLTESEQEAYREVLNGPPISEEEILAKTEDGLNPVPQGRGCAGESLDQARDEQKGALYAREDPDFQDLFEAENALYEPLNAEAPTNEDVIALNVLWNQCMTKVGHSVYDSPLNARNTLGLEFEQMETASSDSDQPLSKAEQDRFQTLEIDVASADLSCRQSVNYEAELDQITRELEQIFVDEYKPRLEALVIRYGTP